MARERLTRGRRLSVRVAALLGLLLFGFFFSIVAAEALGVIQSEPEGDPDDPPASAEAVLGASRPGEAVHVVGALGVLVLGGTALVGLFLRPERSGSAYQVLATMSGILLTAPIVGNPDNRGGQAGWIDPLFLIVVTPAVVAAALARPWRHWRLRRVRGSQFLVLGAVAAVPLGWYGLNQALMQRNTYPPTADPHHNAHWWAMSCLAFIVVLVVAAAALPSDGWRLGPRVAGLAAIALGIASLVASSSASAIWLGWALIAILWGLTGVWLTLRDEQHNSSTERDHLAS